MLEVYDQSKDSHEHKDGSICQEVNRRVYAFIDGKMEIAQLQEFKEHINKCVSCQTLVQFEKKLIQVIKMKGGQTTQDIPASLREKIRQVFEMEGSEKEDK